MPHYVPAGLSAGDAKNKRTMIHFLRSLSVLPLLWGLSFPVAAQEIMVSDEFQLRSDLDYALIGELKGRVLLFRDLQNSFEVQAYDQNMRSSWTKELALKKRAPEVLAINTIGDEFTIVYKHRKGGETTIRTHRYDASANLIDSLTIVDLGYLFFTPDFTVVRSEDRSKLLIYYVEKQRILRAHVFDNVQMKLLWSRSFEPDDYRWAEDILHVDVDNKGVMHYVIEKDNYRAQRKSSSFDIYQYPVGESDLLNFHEVELKEDLNIYDLYFRYDNQNNRLTAGGFYYYNSSSRAEGYFFFTYPDQAMQHIVSYHKFSESFVETIIGKDIRKNRGLEEVKIQDVVLRQDGGILIIGEEARNFQRRLASTNRMVYDGVARSITDFYYNDIFTLCLHPDGKLDWEKIMHKKQYSQDDFGVFSSFFLFKNPASLRFIFNDEIKLENTVSQYALFSSGRTDRTSLLSTTNLNLRLRFRDAVQISPTKILVPSERRNRVRIARIELD